MSRAQVEDDGGVTNSYDYPADPINRLDLTGMSDDALDDLGQGYINHQIAMANISTETSFWFAGQLLELAEMFTFAFDGAPLGGDLSALSSVFRSTEPVVATKVTLSTLTNGAASGWTRHGLNSSISHEGGGVSPGVYLDALRAPVATTTRGIEASAATITYKGALVSVVVRSSDRRIITMYPTKTRGRRSAW